MGVRELGGGESGVGCKGDSGCKGGARGKVRCEGEVAV